MNEQQLVKLKARASGLLDQFIGLRETFAMLEPLAFDKDLTERVGRGPQGRGHHILQNSLLEACVQDLAKLALDQDKRVPSVGNIMATLEDPDVRRSLKETFAMWIVPPADDDEEVKDLLAAVRAREEAERRDEFDRLWDQLSEGWEELKDDEALTGFKTWRDKLIAHTDLQYDKGEYRLLDLSTLGLKWGDIGRLINELQLVVDHINLVCRGASFAFDMLDKQLEETAEGFWSLLGPAPDADRSDAEDLCGTT